MKAAIILTLGLLVGLAPQPVRAEPIHQVYFPMVSSAFQPLYGCQWKTACEYYENRDQAQTQFNYCGGSAQFNWSWLDEEDRDRRVCEFMFEIDDSGKAK